MEFVALLRQSVLIWKRFYLKLQPKAFGILELDMSGAETVSSITGVISVFGGWNSSVPGTSINGSSVPTGSLSMLERLAQFTTNYDTVLSAADFVTNSSAAADPLYGNAAYLWTTPGTNRQLALYENSASVGGGDVYGLTNVSNPAGKEADMFLSGPRPSTTSTLNYVTNVSLSSKIMEYLSLYYAGHVQTTPQPTNEAQLQIGFYINYNGTGGLPKYVGNIQIMLMTTDNQYLYANNVNETPTTTGAIFAYQNTFTQDGTQAALNADSVATPDTFTYNMNEYAAAAITKYFVNSSAFNSSQKATLEDMANWHISGIYFGSSTNDTWVPGSGGSMSVPAGSATISAQLSSILVESNTTEIYSLGGSVPAYTAFVDSNPQLSYFDKSEGQSGTSGTVDGALIGTGSTAYNEYIYNGYDSVSLSVPSGANWDFGGGYGVTTLYASAGNNTFEGSYGTTSVTASTYVDVAGGTGTVNVHANGHVTIIGSSSSQIDAFEYGDSSIYAAGTATVGLHAADTVSAHFAFINNSSNPAYLYTGATGSVTVSGGTGGGYFVGGSAGSNSLMGGAGVVTLVAGGNGDVLAAAGSASGGGNNLFAGSGNETLTANTVTGANLFELGANAGNDMVSTAGVGAQSFFLQSTNAGSVSTITGSAAASSNVFWLDADTAAPGSYVLQNLFPSTSWDLYLENGTNNGPGSATVSSVGLYSGYAAINLSDGAVITLVGATGTNLHESTISSSNGPITYFY